MTRNASPPRRPSGARVIVALMAITAIGPLAVHLFFPLMPAVKRSFAIPDWVAGLGFSLTLLTMGAVTLVYGSLSDRYGRRPVLLAGLSLFCAGCAVASTAASVEMLLAGRILQALGAGCGVTLARAIARDTYGTDSLVKIVAYLTVASTIAPMVAPLLAGMLADAVGWRSVFWLCLLAGVLIALAVYRVLPETRPAEDLALQSKQLWRNYATLLAMPRFDAFVLTSGFASGTFMSMATASAFLMQDTLGRSATEFGGYFSLYAIGYLIGNLVCSRLTRRHSVEAMLVMGSALQLVVILGQAAVVLSGHLDPLTLFIPGFLCTFAHGLTIPNAQAGAIRVKPHLAGTASGLGVFGQMFLGALFSQVYVLLADGTPHTMVIVSITGAVLTLVAGSMPHLLRRRGGAG